VVGFTLALPILQALEPLVPLTFNVAFALAAWAVGAGLARRHYRRTASGDNRSVKTTRTGSQGDSVGSIGVYNVFPSRMGIAGVTPTHVNLDPHTTFSNTLTRISIGLRLAYLL
jgi:hypothetical protein